MTFGRYAIFALPDGAFHDKGAAWLGWDARAGRAVAYDGPAELPGRAEDLTATPRRYGFHGTLKPPFRLAPGAGERDLVQALDVFCARRPPVEIPDLVIRRLGRFVAIAPAAPVPALADLAAAVVAGLDPFRAPAGEAEMARRRRAGLSENQERMLRYWGYPYVMDEFRFHVTLSGALPEREAGALAHVLAGHFAPVLPSPWRLGELGLLGEDPDGFFHLVHTATLSG